MIDLHCHYLPGVDDGAPDLAAGLALARAAVDNGILIAVLTPHVLAGRWDNRRSTLEPAFEAFRRSVDEAGIPLELHLGAEVHLMPASLGLLEADELPSLGRWHGERVILLELPDGGVPVGAMKAVEILRRHGAVPMLAHPERNRSIMRDTTRLEPFVEAGCLVQLTAASVCGWFGAPAKRAAQEILDAGWATAVASDAHNLRHRPPVLAEARHALAMHYGEDAARELTELNPLLIVAGRDAGPVTAAGEFDAVLPPR
jgi:protein-tyrosine phosphatase